jgi:ATP-binding cassette subfamily C protein CydCD
LRPFDPRLSKYARQTSAYLLGSIIIGVLNTLLIIFFSIKIANLVTFAFQNQQVFPNLFNELFNLVLIVIARSFLIWLNEFIAIKSASIAKSQLRQAVMKHAQELGPVAINKFRVNHLANTLTSGIDGLDAYFARYLPQLILVILAPLMVGYVILRNDILSFIIVIFTLPIIPIFMILVGWFTNQENEKQWKSLQKLSNYMNDLFQGFSTLAVNKRLKNQDDTLKKVSSQYRKNLMNVLRISFLSSFVLELAATLSVALIAVSIGVRLVDGKMSLFTGLLVLLLAPEVYLPMRAVGANYHAAAEGLGATNEIYEFLETKPSLSTGVLKLNSTEKVKIEDLEIKISEELSLSNINLEAEKNKLTVLIGASGSGKTTLINSLLGFVPINNGTIRFIDQHGIKNIFDIDLSDLRNNISLLSQFPYLLPGTILSNIKLNKKHISDIEVLEILKRLKIDYLIQQEVNENGQGISTGERRRIALARILLNPKPIVILDEPTASLDIESEEIIIREIENLKNNHIVIASTHHEKLIKLADKKYELNITHKKLESSL